ncbi:type IV secretory system conjugative DNA transfer family protein [Candidatus Nitrosotenuis uzonensis]|uniref:Type IV secretion system coupling protein TraD DNA-binding domain-containing protein n=1 Tax=Candidatus Nitrosotenuis uzonensis TaxID=1407055 RepID=V6AUX4_9ARCH|nr:TraM recognition domain-containing protein [Candidatus Nitrosotenuis uzonensis]CDI06327.1 hypothetical protein NITUZ_40493 [Candidatus Nitrosotenuis uzonensis]
MEFGNLSNMLRDNVIGIAPEDLSRHVYVLGGTGSGKTSLIRNLYKHLEEANHSKLLSSSLIYIDVKDEDANLFLRQCSKKSFDNDQVQFFDLNHTDFTINLLELPKHNLEDRDSVVSRMVGHAVEMFKEFYSQPQTYVQMERILRLLLFYLYSNTNAPSITDLYSLIVRLQNDGKYALDKILTPYTKLSNLEIRQALSSISVLSKDVWAPLLNRFEMFATDNYLKKRFDVTSTNIDFEKILSPGQITIFRISDTETPKHVHSMAIMAVVLKIWFMVQYRATQIKQQERSLVLLALDEFQKIKDLSIITTMLSQARSYNLGLILSHQNLSQINESLLEIIVGNTATQFFGRVSGLDAGKIAKIIDPHFIIELTDQIATQPDYVFTAKTRPPFGQQQSTPIQLKLDPPPELLLDNAETNCFIEKMTVQHNNNIIRSDFSFKHTIKTEWMKQLSAPYRNKDEWEILLFLKKQNGIITEIVEATKSTNRNKTKAIIQSLIAEGLIDTVMLRKQGSTIVRKYSLSLKAINTYFTVSFDVIGYATDVAQVAKAAHQYYLNKRFFIVIANQNRQNKTMSDMVAYDYDNNIAISVEIESRSEISSHPEQVRFNMIKWKELGFSECHVWAKTTDRLQKIKSKLGSEYDKVKIFHVD